MSDKELEEYINKIEPNFNSHLEKGTIEMSNEYYNLLEERMARIINKNQELKEEIKRVDERNKDLVKICQEFDDRINKSIEYIQNHQLVFRYHTIEEIDEWFNQFYKDLLEILRGEK